jgi:hypothetical protein
MKQDRLDLSRRKVQYSDRTDRRVRTPSLSKKCAIIIIA